MKPNFVTFSRALAAGKINHPSAKTTLDDTARMPPAAAYAATQTGTRRAKTTPTKTSGRRRISAHHRVPLSHGPWGAMRDQKKAGFSPIKIICSIVLYDSMGKKIQIQKWIHRQLPCDFSWQNFFLIFFWRKSAFSKKWTRFFGEWFEITVNCLRIFHYYHFENDFGLIGFARRARTKHAPCNVFRPTQTRGKISIHSALLFLPGPVLFMTNNAGMRPETQANATEHAPLPHSSPTAPQLDHWIDESPHSLLTVAQLFTQTFSLSKIPIDEKCQYAGGGGRTAGSQTARTGMKFHRPRPRHPAQRQKQKTRLLRWLGDHQVRKKSVNCRNAAHVAE